MMRLRVAMMAKGGPTRPSRECSRAVLETGLLMLADDINGEHHARLLFGSSVALPTLVRNEEGSKARRACAVVPWHADGHDDDAAASAAHAFQEVAAAALELLPCRCADHPSQAAASVRTVTPSTKHRFVAVCTQAPARPGPPAGRAPPGATTCPARGSSAGSAAGAARGAGISSSSRRRRHRRWRNLSCTGAACLGRRSRRAAGSPNQDPGARWGEAGEMPSRSSA